MIIICCGVRYSSSDPKYHYCFEKSTICADKIPSARIRMVDKINQRRKNKNLEPYVFDEKRELYKNAIKIQLEEVYTFLCPKNGCLKVRIEDWGIKNKQKIKLNQRDLSSKDALEFLNETNDLRVREKMYLPSYRAISTRNLPLTYAKAISPTKQRARFINESGWRDGQIFESKVTIKHIGEI